MKILDIVHVIGRGYIFIGQPDAAIHIGDKMRFNDQEFNISGIEISPGAKSVGLVLSHSEAAYKIIHKGDEVEIISTPARGQVPDRIEDNLRWIDDIILRKLKEQENWPKGTEVIIYCHDCDLEKVTTEIERKGYKVAHHVSCDQDRILAYAIHEGQYVMCKKKTIIWNQNKT